MSSELVAQKTAMIGRALDRVREEYAAGDFRTDVRAQDMVVLNLQRACEATIDIAMHLVRTHRLHDVSDARSAFHQLWRADLIAPELGRQLEKMVGFRNTVVHSYQELDLGIVETVASGEMNQLLRFADAAFELEKRAGR